MVVSDRRVGPLLSLLRQGIKLDLEFGSHSLESLLRIAETVEESVYVPGSLETTPRGLRFALENPPLRMGAFRALRAFVNGAAVGPASVRFRSPGGAWRDVRDLGHDRPLELLPGTKVDFELDVSPPPAGEVTVRLELENIAIPPLVWFEFREPARPAGASA